MIRIVNHLGRERNWINITKSQKLQLTHSTIKQQHSTFPLRPGQRWTPVTTTSTQQYWSSSQNSQRRRTQGPCTGKEQGPLLLADNMTLCLWTATEVVRAKDQKHMSLFTRNVQNRQTHQDRMQAGGYHTRALGSCWSVRWSRGGGSWAVGTALMLFASKW